MPSSTHQKPTNSPTSSSQLSLARSSPGLFAYYASGGRWRAARHLRLISYWLVEVAAGRCKRLIITLPPRHGKSMLCSQWFPAWYLGVYPRNRIILVSYEARFAASWGRKARDIYAEHAPAFFDTKLSATATAAEWWETSLSGGMTTAGVGGPITGKGGHVILIDDPFKNDEQADSQHYRESLWDWYQSTLYTRLESEPEGAIVLMMTRWHHDDLAGRLIAAAGEDGDQWKVINLPAFAEEGDALGREVGEPLWPKRFDQDRLQKIKSNLQSGRWWWALYQQRPTPPSGSVFQLQWLKSATPPEKFDQIIQAWDTAFKEKQTNDYSVCVTLGIVGNLAYVLWVYRARLEMPALLAAMKEQAARWKPRVILIEDAASGMSAIQLLRKETKLPIISISPKGDKVFRANLVVPYVEGQRVALCHGPWRGEFEEELISFPKGQYDDQVDAFVHALTRVFLRGGGSLMR